MSSLEPGDVDVDEGGRERNWRRRRGDGLEVLSHVGGIDRRVCQWEASVKSLTSSGARNSALLDG
jgi:hypothetical protein